jgi:acyl-coenzyme A thioesterase PaaI-like protein
MGDDRRRYDHSLVPINDDSIDHHCFGCGNGNPHGLRLRFRPLPDDGVWADFTPTRDHEGYMGMTHGGILSTVADEAMSWAVTAAGDLGVTARLALTFRRAAHLGDVLRVEAWIDKRRSRTIETRAEIRSIDSGELLAEAEARFVRVSREQAAAFREAYGEQINGSAFGAAAIRNAAVSDT